MKQYSENEKLVNKYLLPILNAKLEMGNRTLFEDEDAFINIGYLPLFTNGADVEVKLKDGLWDVKIYSLDKEYTRTENHISFNVYDKDLHFRHALAKSDMWGVKNISFVETNIIESIRSADPEKYNLIINFSNKEFDRVMKDI